MHKSGISRPPGLTETSCCHTAIFKSLQCPFRPYVRVNINVCAALAGATLPTCQSGILCLCKRRICRSGAIYIAKWGRRIAPTSAKTRKIFSRSILDDVPFSWNLSVYSPAALCFETCPCIQLTVVEDSPSFSRFLSTVNVVAY